MATLFATGPQSFGPAPRRAVAASEEVSEFYHYEDTGCEASDSCLDCPLPRCKYDDPVWYRRNRRLARDFRIVRVMQQEALSVEETALRFSMTQRTVFRVMQRCRQAMAQPGAGEALPLAA